VQRGLRHAAGSKTRGTDDGVLHGSVDDDRRVLKIGKKAAKIDPNRSPSNPTRFLQHSAVGDLAAGDWVFPADRALFHGVDLARLRLGRARRSAPSSCAHAHALADRKVPIIRTR